MGPPDCNSSALTTSPCKGISETVLDSGFHNVDSGIQLLDSRSFSVDIRFRIPIVSGIPDSYSCIPAQVSGFHKQKFPVFPYIGRHLATLLSFRQRHLRHPETHVGMFTLYFIHYYIMYYTVYIIADHCSLIHSCTKTHTEISKSNSK